MRLAWLLFSLLLMLPAALGQSCRNWAMCLEPFLSPQMERSIGEAAMRDIRFREPSYLDDPELADYISFAGAPPDPQVIPTRAWTSSSSWSRTTP